MSRIRRRRSSDQEYCVFVPHEQGLRVVRRISGRVGDSLVRQGKAICHRSASGTINGYELINEKSVAMGAAYSTVNAAGTLGAAVCISRREVEANAGFYGKSKTIGLCDDQRQERVRQNLPGYDLVELAAVKVKAWTPKRSG